MEGEAMKPDMRLAKFSRYDMKDSTAETVLSALDLNIWRTAKEVAELIGQTEKNAMIVLRKIRAAGGPIECQVEPLQGGGTRLRFRKLPPGSAAPIFEKVPGWDDRDINEVMKGYVPTERPLLDDEPTAELPKFTGGGGEFGGAGASGDWQSDHNDHGGTPHDDNDADLACRDDSSSSSSSDSYSSPDSSSSDSSSCSTD